MQDNLQKLLYKKYLDKNLAALYIAKYDSAFIDPELWAKEFLGQFTSLEDHPDVLKINKTEKETEYKVDSLSIKNFLKFLNYRPIQLEKKFIFLFDAQDLSVILSNKLLKIFEELDAHFCLILMVPDKAPMLATVESRAIKLQISAPQNSDNQNSFDFGKLKTPMDLMNYLKQASGNSQYDEKKFIEHAIAQILLAAQSTPQSFNDLEALLRSLENFETANNFNNSKLSRITPFFP